MANEFDLFAGLASISKKDYLWYDKLSEAGKKAASPLVIGRWMTGTTDQTQLILMNSFVNPYGFSLGQDKSLLFKLLSASSTGRNVRYNWIKAPGGKKNTKLKIEAIKQFYNVSTREANLYLANISDDDIMEYVEALGWDKEELAKLKKELTDGSGSVKKTGVKPKK